VRPVARGDRYLQSHPDEPDAVLLADEEVRDYRVCLASIKRYNAATVNAYQTPIRAIAPSPDA
jgi:hypothetical protein